MKTLNFKEHYNYIKENLSVILLIPTIMGGLWQLLELSTISTSFIRFFSISQLVADGILILFLISILYATFIISGKIIKKNNFQFNSNKPPLSIWFCIISIIFGLFAFFFIPLPLLQEIQKRKSITILEIVLLIPVITMTIGSILLGFFRLLENFIYHHPNFAYNCIKRLRDDKKTKENIISTLAFAIVLIGLFLIKFILLDMNPYISSFRQYIIFPENLINKELLDKRIIKDYHLKFKPILIYNNDKYFFYKVYDAKKNEKILIIDYAELTEK